MKKPLSKNLWKGEGADRNLWIWEPCDYSRTYMVIADVARGDGKDHSAFHIIDVENNVQVGEYKGQLGTKEYGHLLVGIATEYNNALLVVENASIGWATIQTIIDRGYDNLYYSPKGGEVRADSYFDRYMDTSKMVAGFTMSSRTRPMVIGKFQEYISDKGVTFYSKRLLEEMKTFIWRNGRPEAQSGYNDDLVMSFGIAMYMRDTAFKYKQQGVDLTKSMLNGIATNKTNHSGVYTPNGTQTDNPWKINNPYSGGGRRH